MSTSFEMLCTVCLTLLLHLSSGVFVRIVNIYEGVYLNEQLTPTTKMDTYWDFENGILWNRKRSSKLCVNSGTLDLCSDSSNQFKWIYNEGKLELRTVMIGVDLFLTLNSTTAGVTPTNNSTAAKILVSVAVGDATAPLAEKLSESLEKLKGDISSVTDKYNLQNNTTQKIKIRSHELGKLTEITEEEYDQQIKKFLDELQTLKDKKEEAVEEIEKNLSAVNTTQHNMTEITLHSMDQEIADLREKPNEFETRLLEKDLVDSVKLLAADFNSSLVGYLNSHRVAPVSPYDWMFIACILLYIVYFVDIVGRVSGWKLTGKREQSELLEMEAPGPPENIQPEYYLKTDESSSTFELNKQNIEKNLRLDSI